MQQESACSAAAWIHVGGCSSLSLSLPRSLARSLARSLVGLMVLRVARPPSSSREENGVQGSRCREALRDVPTARSCCSRGVDKRREG